MSAVIESAMVTKLIDVLTKEVAQRLGKVKDIIPTFRIAPTKFSFTELDRATTTNQKYDMQNPDLEFKNPKNTGIALAEYLLIPDASFQTKGLVLITVDDSKIFESRTAGAFTDLVGDEIKISGGKSMKRDEIIKVFIKSSDGTAVSLTVQPTFRDG